MEGCARAATERINVAGGLTWQRGGSVAWRCRGRRRLTGRVVVVVECCDRWLAGWLSAPARGGWGLRLRGRGRGTDRETAVLALVHEDVRG
jgi:hypothetical protein